MKAGIINVHTKRLYLFAAALVLGACAQASPPPGGIQDRFSPRVVETEPAQRAIVSGFDDEVRITFDETLSERGAREDDLVLVSPATGEIGVNRAGKELRVKLEGGWQPNRVYHVTILPGLQDRRGNARIETYELVFSTGPEILPTVMAGLVADRLTGKPVANARVQAIDQRDSAIYVTATDTAGFFALQSLPPGTFTTTAYVDLNRNREIDAREARDRKGVILGRDTQAVEFALLAPDTTPARLLKAEAKDSLQIRLSLDDFIAPEEPLQNFVVSMWILPDSVAMHSGRLMMPRDFDALRPPARDSVPPPPVTRAPVRPATRPLPTQELVWVPFQPLRPKTRYRIGIGNVRNIAGVANGGGNVVFETPARPQAPAKPDSAAARPDSIRR